MSDFVLTGATVLAGQNLSPQENSWVKVNQQGRIADVGTGHWGGSNTTQLDATGTIICPAFLNGHTHVIDGFLKEVGFGMPYWDVFMPPEGLRHQALARTSNEVLKEQLGRTLDQMIACGTGQNRFCQSVNKTHEMKPSLINNPDQDHSVSAAQKCEGGKEAVRFP